MHIKISTHFFLDLGDVHWNTLDADIKFSIYCPRTWFSDFSFKFSSFTLSTLWDKSKGSLKQTVISFHYNHYYKFILHQILFQENCYTVVNTGNFWNKGTKKKHLVCALFQNIVCVWTHLYVIWQDLY